MYTVKKLKALKARTEKIRDKFLANVERTGKDHWQKLAEREQKRIDAYQHLIEFGLKLGTIPTQEDYDLVHEEVMNYAG